MYVIKVLREQFEKGSICSLIAYMSFCTALLQVECTYYYSFNMFPGNGVQRGLRCVFSCFLGCVKNVSPVSTNMFINHAVLKRQLAQRVQVKSCTNVSAQIKTQLHIYGKVKSDQIICVCFLVFFSNCVVLHATSRDSEWDKLNIQISHL